MAFEIYQQVIYIIINLFALLAAIFSINTFLKIRRQQKQPEIRAMLSKVFLFFSVGVMLWVIAEFGWDMSFYMYGELPGITFLDLFWMAGYFFLLPAFAYFNIYILQKRQNMKKGLAVLGIATVVLRSSYITLSRHTCWPMSRQG
ncbi:MAG: hypothetical protein KJ574_05300 [Nanoarchaeota archaeon]|nr:hypothetical protein [Nanoarchaeota archaeon]